jgi:hypothetical protein
MYSSRCIERIFTGVGIKRVGFSVGGDVLGKGVTGTVVGVSVACIVGGDVAAEWECGITGTGMAVGKMSPCNPDRAHDDTVAVR